MLDINNTKGNLVSSFISIFNIGFLSAACLLLDYDKGRTCISLISDRTLGNLEFQLRKLANQLIAFLNAQCRFVMFCLCESNLISFIFILLHSNSYLLVFKSNKQPTWFKTFFILTCLLNERRMEYWTRRRLTWNVQQK